MSVIDCALCVVECLFCSYSSAQASERSAGPWQKRCRCVSSQGRSYWPPIKSENLGNDSSYKEHCAQEEVPLASERPDRPRAFKRQHLVDEAYFEWTPLYFDFMLEGETIRSRQWKRYLRHGGPVRVESPFHSDVGSTRSLVLTAPKKEKFRETLSLELLLFLVSKKYRRRELCTDAGIHDIYIRRVIIIYTRLGKKHFTPDFGFYPILRVAPRVVKARERQNPKRAL